MGCGSYYDFNEAERRRAERAAKEAEAQRQRDLAAKAKAEEARAQTESLTRPNLRDLNRAKVR